MSAVVHVQGHQAGVFVVAKGAPEVSRAGFFIFIFYL
jgi:hypothetical protein